METYLNRKVKETHVFNTETGCFKNLYKAQIWLLENGYEYGSLCICCPVAVVRGKYNLPQKWGNMTHEVRDNVDGVITGKFLEGEVKVIIFD